MFLPNLFAATSSVSSKTMGFEIETSTFKVINNNDTLLESRTHKWEFKADTADQSIQANTESLSNIEAKTTGGLNREEITQATEDIIKVWSFFDSESKKTPEQVKTQTAMEEGIKYIDQTTVYDFKKIENAVNTEKKSAEARSVSITDSATKNKIAGQYLTALEKVCDILIEENSKLVGIANDLIERAQYHIKKTDLKIAIEGLPETTEVFSDVKILKPNRTQDHQRKLCQPQITYCLPLSEIENLLKRLAQKFGELENAPNTPFYNFLSDTFPEFLSRIKTPRPPAEKQTGSDDQKQAVRTLLKRIPRQPPAHDSSQTKKQIYQQMVETLNTELSQNLHSKGLAWLFILYAHSLFWNEEPITKEAGPKPALGIMSRIPFSSMYNNLSENDKRKFLSFIERVKEKHPNLFERKILEYTTAEGTLKDNDKITLNQWITSITGGSEKDLLSPPPGCDKSYAMGFYPPPKEPNQKNALIEVRAYSKLKIGENNEDITLDNFQELIESEATWFFGRSGGTK